MFYLSPGRAAWLFCWLALLSSLSTAEQGTGGGFFSITISTGQRNSYYYGERVFVEAVVHNPTENPLTYLATGDLPVFISHLCVCLTKDGEPVPRGTRAPVFGVAPSLHKSLILRLPPGASLECRKSLDSICHPLSPGTYTLWATLTQRVHAYGLTTGEAVSNRVQFIVKRWKPKAYVERVWDHKAGPNVLRETARIVETTDGRFFVSWRTVRLSNRKLGRQRQSSGDTAYTVVGIPVKLRLDSTPWAATEDECYIVTDQVRPQGRLLINVRRNDSTVSVVELRSAGPVHHTGSGASIWWLVVPGSGAAAYLWFWLRRRQRTAHSVLVRAKENGGKSSAHAGDT